MLYIIDGNYNLNLGVLGGVQRKIFEKYINQQGYICHLVLAIYIITWNGIKIEKRLSSFLLKHIIYLIEIYIKQLIY